MDSTGWPEWRKQHPQTTVLSTDTGYFRNYQIGAAYGEYFASADTMFPVWRRSTRLPFKAAAFDLVVSRHEELDPAEVDRVLRPGGLLVTQQVGRHNWREARSHLPRMTDDGDLLSSYSRRLRGAGFDVNGISTICSTRLVNTKS